MQTARVQWIGKEQFVAQSPSGNLVALDSDRVSNGAPGPMELLLMALGTCTATDVVAVLAQCSDAWAAARAGVLVHAMAGDAAARVGERGVLATDLLRELPHCVNL